MKKGKYKGGWIHNEKKSVLVSVGWHFGLAENSSPQRMATGKWRWDPFVCNQFCGVTVKINPPKLPLCWVFSLKIVRCQYVQCQAVWFL